MAYNRELSQFASFVDVNNDSKRIGFSTDLNVLGIITATRFYGSGRFLTDITATEVPIGTADDNQIFYSDNSELKGASDFYYNQSNNNVGIGTSIPTSKLSVVGNVLISGITTVTGSTLFTNQLSVSGVTTFAGITTVTGSTLFTNQLSVSGVTTFAGITTVTGSTLFTNQLSVSGVTTLAGITTVTGVTLFTNQLSVSGVTTFAGITTVTGSTLFTRQLSVSGVTTLAGITTVTGVTLFTNQLSVSGVTTFAGITTVTGVTLFTRQLSVSGVATAQDFNSLSDINLKTNIESIDNAIEIIGQLRGVKFKWKETQKSSIGVIAQELEEILPELVSTGEIKTVNYSGLIGVLIESIKYLNKEIEELKNNK